VSHVLIEQDQSRHGDDAAGDRQALAGRAASSQRDEQEQHPRRDDEERPAEVANVDPDKLADQQDRPDQDEQSTKHGGLSPGPSRRVSRVTWVSTANPGMPKATPSTTLAVFLPTPGKVTRSSIRGGTSPPNRSTRAALQATIVFALTWKNPVGLMRASTAWGSAWASAAASGYLANNAGVTELTDRS